VAVGDEMARNVGPPGIEVAHERFRDSLAPPAPVMMGGGAQMINWPEASALDWSAVGVRVIRFDNHDSGVSSHFPDALAPDLRAALAGDFSSVSYALT
jgi:hypothetical protein